VPPDVAKGTAPAPLYRIVCEIHPTAIASEVVGKILYLRQHYHFGPGKIADYLKRFHQLTVAVSSVHRILARHDMTDCPRTKSIDHTRSGGSATRSRNRATDCRAT
jgi:hypothetical protein